MNASVDGGRSVGTSWEYLRDVINPLKSKAVVVYTSRGRSGFPWPDPDAVRDMPVPDAVELVRYVEALQMEMYDAFPLWWRGDDEDLDLGQAMAQVARGLSQRHPELDTEAIDALAWMWGYNAQK